VSEALEDVRARLEEKGSSMTDTTPLLKIKGALAALRGEAQQLEVMGGVVGHAVMQSRLSHKALAGRGGSGEAGDEEDEDEGEEDGEGLGIAELRPLRR
jgi:estrogen-related receptor beta like 1